MNNENFINGKKNEQRETVEKLSKNRLKTGEEINQSGDKAVSIEQQANSEKKDNSGEFAELIIKELKTQMSVTMSGEKKELSKKEIAVIRLIRTLINPKTTDTDFLKAFELTLDTINIG